MRAGIIGVGRLGRVHAHLLRDDPRVDDLLILDVDAALAETVATELGGTVAADVDALLAAVDCVAIVTPTTTHVDLVEHAVRAGITTFCEKPLALDPMGFERVEAAIARHGGRVQVGLQRRFDPPYAAARELVASGKIGRLYTVRTNTNDRQPPPEAYVAPSGGIFADMLIHDFDLIRFVTGEEVTEVYATGSVLVEEYFGHHGDVDTAVALLRLTSGVLGVASAARRNPYGHDVRMELFGSEDHVVVGLDPRTPLRRIQGDAVATDPYADFADRFHDAYRRELDVFLSFAAGEIDSPCTVADAREAVRIAIACDWSRREHRPVRLEEVA